MEQTTTMRVRITLLVICFFAVCTLGIAGSVGKISFDPVEMYSILLMIIGLGLVYLSDYRDKS